MATRLYVLQPGGSLETVGEYIGSANTSAIVNLSIDLASSVTDTGGGSRAINKAEVIIALDVLQQYIIRSNWVPA